MERTSAAPGHAPAASLGCGAGSSEPAAAGHGVLQEAEPGC